MNDYFKELANNIKLEDFQDKFKEEAQSIKDDLKECDTDYEALEIVKTACENCKAIQCNYCTYYTILQGINVDEEEE